MVKFIVNCEIKKITDTDESGNLLLKPVIATAEYARIFDSEEQVEAFLAGELLPVRQIA